MSSEILFSTRANEFEEIVHVLELETDKPNWKRIVLQFCLDFHVCLQNWTVETSSNNSPIQKMQHHNEANLKEKGSF